MFIPIKPNQMVTASLSGTRIKFSYCNLDKAISNRSVSQTAFLKEQLAVGAIEIRIVQPRQKQDDYKNDRNEI